MKTKIFNGSKRTALAIAVLMFTLSIIGGLASIFSTKAFATGEKVNIVYSSTDLNYAHGVTYTDDTGKSGIQFTTVKSGNDAEGSTFSFADTMTGTFDMDFRVTSEKAYTPVNTTVGWSHYLKSGNGHIYFNEDINAYLDLRQVGIKFTSATNPDKYFILYIYGAAAYQAMVPTAYVYVNGDNTNVMKRGYDTGNVVSVKGYGYNYHWHWEQKDFVNQNYTAYDNIYDLKNYSQLATLVENETDYVHTAGGGNTPISGTTFCNFLPTKSGDGTVAKTTSNMIKFDPATMNVYVNSGRGHNGTYSTINNTADVMVRDVANNTNYDANGTSNTVASIQPEDFANGYSVEVIFDDITSDSQTGANAGSIGGISDFANNGYKVIDQAYARHGRLTVYSVNGVALTEENLNVLDSVSNRSGEDYIDYSEDNYTVTENYTNALDNKTGLRIQSLQSGAYAQDKGFTLTDKMVGNFDLDFRINSKETYAHPLNLNADTGNYVGWTHYLTNGWQKALMSDYNNPYADVQEVAFTFISAIDPDKYFTVYIMGTAADLAFATSASVMVNGDNMFSYGIDSQTGDNVQYYRGYGLNNGTINYQGGTNWGSSGVKGYQTAYTKIPATSFSNYTAKASGDGTAMPTTSNLIKFNPETMEVFVNAGTGYSNLNTNANVLVRNIATNAGYTWANTADEIAPTLGSIQPEDFANGYSVEVAFTRVTDNNTVGDSSKFGGASQYPTIIETPYERYVDMTIYSLNGRDLGLSSVADNGKPVVTAPVATMEKGVEVDLAPLFYDGIGGNTVGVYGKVEVATDGVTFTEVTKNAENKYLYTPETAGTYTVKYSGFKDEQGNAIVDTTSTISCYVVEYDLTYGVDKTATFEKGTVVNLSNYVTEVEGKKFVGWKINGALYTADYEITMNSDITVEPVYLGFALEDGAYIRIVAGENAGIRFIANVNGADLDALIALVGEESLTFVYNMTANEITKTQTKSYEEFLTITEFDGTNYSTALAITNVKVDNASVLWTGEIALKIAYANGESTISAGSVARSVQEVANAVISDAETYNALSPEKQAIVNQYAGN